MKLHVLTAVSRPWNLSVIAGSLAVAKARAPEMELTWHLRFDLDRTQVGGQALKNAMLAELSEWSADWVWILDDDTLVHEDLLRVLQECGYQGAAVVVSQRRNDGRILRSGPRNVALNSIDAGQAILRRELIGHTYIPETYAGDGEWLIELLAGREDVLYLKNVLSLHNVLSGVEVSE